MASLPGCSAALAFTVEFGLGDISLHSTVSSLDPCGKLWVSWPPDRNLCLYPLGITDKAGYRVSQRLAVVTFLLFSI